MTRTLLPVGMRAVEMVQMSILQIGMYAQTRVRTRVCECVGVRMSVAHACIKQLVHQAQIGLDPQSLLLDPHPLIGLA